MSARLRSRTQVLDTVEEAIADIAAGRPIIVVDDADRENEGDLVFAASKATPELLAFTIRHARGLICVPMLGEDLDRLHLPQMTSDNQEHMGTAFTISVDARTGITTGICAADRARTIQLLASPDAQASDLVRPAISSRCATPRAACCAAPGTPRPRSTWPGWPGCPRRASYAKW